MTKKDRNEGVTCSRRNFLQGGLAVGAALGTAALGLAGCSQENGNASEPQLAGTGEASGNAPVAYYSTDVLILGTGGGGVFAALSALGNNVRVMCVDKGPFRYSGATGMNWDAGSDGLRLDVPDPSTGVGPWSDPLTNVKVSRAAIEWCGSNPEAWSRALAFCRMGNTTFWRNEKGELAIPTNEQTFMRHSQRYLDSVDVDVVDNTMITGLMVNDDGVCAGAIGLHVPTGSYRVFRAKATIIANGGSTQMYGWSGTGALSINVPDNTGDVDVAAYRQGCSLINPEFFCYDLISMWPPAIGGSFAAGIGADSVSKDLVCDSDGDRFLADFAPDAVYVPITSLVNQRIREGKGSERGCAYLDLSSDDAEELTRPAYYRNVQLWKDVFDIDVTLPENKPEIGVEAFEHLGTPVVDESMMTQIPGLFNVRGAGNMLVLLTNHTLAAYAGHCASDYATKTDMPLMSQESINAEVARLEGILASDGSKRPHEIRHAIQNCVFEALHLGASKDGLDSAIVELERIRTQDMPELTISNKTRCMNLEWRQAIENENLLLLSEAALKGTLMREESRLFFERVDFPDTDDENWLANIFASQGQDGSLVLEKVDIETQ